MARTALPSVTKMVSFVGLLEPDAGQWIMFRASLIRPRESSVIDVENVPELVL